jgi:hypothetical protein
MLGEWNLGKYALMLRGIDVGILILIVFPLLEIGLDGRMKNEMRGFLQFQHRGHVGSFLRGASRGLLVSGAVQM